MAAPGPPNKFFGFNHMAPLQRDFRAYTHELATTHGEVVYFHVMGKPIFLISSPDLSHEILTTKSFHKLDQQKRVWGRIFGDVSFTMDGGTWTRRRRLMNPLFAPQAINKYQSTVISQASRRLSQLGSGIVDVTHAMSDVALLSVAEALFGSHVSDVADEFRVCAEEQQRVLTMQATRPALIPLWMPTAENRALKKRMEFFDGLVFRFIEAHRQSGNESHGLLSELLGAVDEESGEGLSDEEIRGETLTVLLAGHDPAAAALCWSSYLLAKHPEYQDHIFAQLSEYGAAEGLKPGMADSLTWPNAVFQESMRIYPPAPVLARQASEPIQVGPAEIPRGGIVMILAYTMHHDSRWHPDPESFQPERFLPENVGKMPKNSYLPFGLGPRACIGKRLAVMEGTLVLAELMRQFRLAIPEGASPPVMETQTSLHPKDGLELALQQR